jgi:hypothetical protein
MKEIRKEKGKAGTMAERRIQNSDFRSQNKKAVTKFPRRGGQATPEAGKRNVGNPGGVELWEYWNDGIVE